jgi:hypothetical protein
MWIAGARNREHLKLSQVISGKKKPIFFLAAQNETNLVTVQHELQLSLKVHATSQNSIKSDCA